MAAATSSNSGNGLPVILAVLVIAILAVGAVYLMQDHRSGGERIGDAVEALPHGVGKAAAKLGDQPPGKNVEHNLGEATQKATN